MKKLIFLLLLLTLPFSHCYSQSAIGKSLKGADGISISNAVVNATGWLNVTLSNNTVLGPWNVTGPAGGGGGYVNFTTNETASIDWPHTFNATDIKKNGVTVLTAESDPTVDSSAEIQAIIGASVYEPFGVAVADITDATANGRSLILSTNYASMRGLLDLEAGTDFYSMSAADTAFEAELDSSAGLLAALNDETGTEKAVFNEAPTIRNTTITGSLTIGEGLLADSVIVSGDIKDGTITAADTALTAGRSLTFTTNDIAADAELYTDTKCIYWENPIATDDFKSIWRPKLAVTVTSIWAESDQTVTFMLQRDDGTPGDLDTVDLAPAAGTAEDTSLDGDAAFAAGNILDMAVTSVANTPTWCSVCWTFTKDD